MTEQQQDTRVSELRAQLKALGYLDAGGVRSVFDPVLTELPLSCENSAYAATEIGPGGTIWTGTFLGLTIYRRG